jgi:hypothetical protein
MVFISPTLSKRPILCIAWKYAKECLSEETHIGPLLAAFESDVCKNGLVLIIEIVSLYSSHYEHIAWEDQIVMS